MMSFEDCLVEALSQVLDWDMPDEVTTEAVNAQACLLAGIGSEQGGDDAAEFCRLH